MIEPQKSELPHETEYFLDGAVECLDLDAGTRMVLIVFGDRQRIADIVEPRIPWKAGPPGKDGHEKAQDRSKYGRFKAKRLEKCDQLTSHADELLAQLDPIYQLGSHITAINNLLTTLRSHAEIYSDWAMTDANEGGAMEAYDKKRLTWYQHAARDKAGTKRVSRKLHSPAWIKRYIEGHEESYRMRALWHKLAQRGAPKYSENQLDAAIGVFDAAYEQHRAKVQAAQQRAMDAFIAETRGIREKARAPYRILAKQKRKVAKRAALFAAGLLGAGTVSAFASGQPVHIEGQHIVFEVKKRGSIHRSGHASLELSVLDKERTKLADLCFFIENTPAIDQLTGIALAVQAGEEQDILSTANITKVATAGVGHKLLGARSLPPEPIQRAAFINGVIMSTNHIPRDARRTRNDTYWIETKDIWINTLGVHVFNREWKNVKGMMPA